MIQLLFIMITNFILSVFFNVDLIRYPKLYYGFLNKCAENQSFTFVSFIFLLIFIEYLAADIYFLYIAFLPYLVEFLCSPSSEVEKALDTNNTASGGIKDSPLLFDDDNKV